PRAAALGARVQADLTNAARFKGDWPGDGDQWAEWQNAIAAIVRRALDQHCQIEWDIWNEPDQKTSWKATRDQFFEHWVRTVRTIREIDPQAVIVGPSISDYNKGWLDAFLKFAKDYDTLPDVLSWHESNVKTEIPGHVSGLNDSLWQDGMNISRISINQCLF